MRPSPSSASHERAAEPAQTRVPREGHDEPDGPADGRQQAERRRPPRRPLPTLVHGTALRVFHDSHTARAMSTSSPAAATAPSGTGPEVAETAPSGRGRLDEDLDVARHGRLLPHVEGVAREHGHVAAAEDHRGQRLGGRVLRDVGGVAARGQGAAAPGGAVTPGAIQAVELAALGDPRRARHRRGELLRHVLGHGADLRLVQRLAERRHVDAALLDHAGHQAREAGGLKRRAHAPHAPRPVAAAAVLGEDERARRRRPTTGWRPATGRRSASRTPRRPKRPRTSRRRRSSPQGAPRSRDRCVGRFSRTPRSPASRRQAAVSHARTGEKGHGKA